MKNRLLILIVAVMAVMTARGEEYKILYLTTPGINIGGKELHTGDIFSSRSTIAWDNPRQAMKVMDIKSSRQLLLVAEKFTETKSRDIASYLIASKQLSARRGAIINTLELGIALADRHYLLDSIIIETSLPTDEEHYFYGSYDYKGETINKKLRAEDNRLVFDRSLFTIDGREIEPFDMILSVWYVDGTENVRKLITDKMEIIPIFSENKETDSL